MTDVQRNPQNVGRILVQVQEDLQQVKEQMNKLQSCRNEVDFKLIDEALSRTEKGIKQNAELMVSMVNNQVTTLPTVDQRNNVQLTPVSVQGRPQLHASVYHDSPGESTDSLTRPVDLIEFHRDLTMKALLNPESLYNRNALHKNYGLVLPAIKDSRKPKMIEQTIAKGSTIIPLSVLPRANRIDPSMTPPPIQEKDARKGILSLIERGLIPPAAELTLDPSPVRHKKASLHRPEIQNRKQLQSECSSRGENSHHMASVKLDLSHENQPPGASLTSQRLSEPPSSANYSLARSTGTRSPQLRSVMIQSPISHRKSGASFTPKTQVITTVFDPPLQPLPPPATPAQKEDQHSVVAASHGYSFFIKNSCLPLDDEPEYNAFHQRYLLQWGSIVSMLGYLQKVLKDYAVPTALVNGNRLAEISPHFELEQQPSLEDLIHILDNGGEVLSLIKTPGRRYQGYRGRFLAASKIQATWRRYTARKKYLQYRKQRWAAGVIAISWILHVRMSRMRKQLRIIRKQHLDNFRARAKTLAVNWPKFVQLRRVIVHVPSLGYHSDMRFGVPGFDRKQNAQMARLCDLRDSNVDVIYISPVEVLDELKQYYCKLLGLKLAVDSGSPESIGNLSERFTIVVPEALNKFPTHHLCLASLLKYSPCALARIRMLIGGRDAVYIPGVIHRDDLAVADSLGIPVLGCEPEICHLYSSKSGSKRVFSAANMLVPPGEHDVYSANQLQESLARLICENPEVRRWLLKVDSGFGGRNIAYIDIDKHLPCYNWMVRESVRYGNKWKQKWAQDASYTKILCELPDTLDNFAVPANLNVFPTWVDFLDTFLSQGGVIEACPPSESITCVTVDMLIDPTGNIQLTSCGDQIHADNPYKSWGTSLPQSSIDPSVLAESCHKIAEACRSRGVMGHFTVDFVTFIDSKVMEQVVWATDLTLSYSDQMAMTQLMLFVTGGEFDVKNCRFKVQQRENKENKRFRKRDENKIVEPPQNLNRFCVMSTNLRHSNMAVVHYSVFFQMCRAHGIGFDIKERQGTVFTLIDSSKREEFGMLTIGNELPGALSAFARNLSIIHQEISAPNMQGKTNFKAAINDIETILSTTNQNENDQT